MRRRELWATRLACIVPIVAAVTFAVSSALALPGGLGYPNHMRFDFWHPRTANGNAVIQDTSNNTLLTITDAGTTGNVMATGDISSGNGHVFNVASGDVYLSTGPTVNAIAHIRGGSGSGVATDYLTVDLNGASLPATGEGFNGPSGANLLVRAGGTNQSVSIQPTNGSGVDTTDTLSVQAAGGSWTTNGTTLVDLTGGALNFPAGGKFGGGTNVAGLHHGTITLSGGTGTATVGSGEHCVCTDTTANVSVRCAVATTTLTATGTTTDVISYLCVK